MASESTNLTGRRNVVVPALRCMAFQVASLGDAARRRNHRRLTLEPGAGWPIWSSDASRILFQWARGANESAVSIQDARGSGHGHLGWRYAGPYLGLVAGRRLLLFSQLLRNNFSISSLSYDLAARAAKSHTIKTRFNESQGRFSPDGRFVAYSSNALGRSEIYVQTFPKPERASG